MVSLGLGAAFHPGAVCPPAPPLFHSFLFQVLQKHLILEGFLAFSLGD